MGITIKDLEFSYGNGFAIKGLDLEIPEGKFTTILGPNGSGKTTLIKTILGFLKPQHGQISLDGRELTGMTAQGKALKMAYVPQTSGNEFDFTVLDVVLMGRHPYLKRFQEASPVDLETARRAMALTGVLDFSDKRVTKLSGGEAQRVSLARAIAQDTPYIFLDEPINHLDISHQVSIMKILREMVPEKTPVAVMHDLNFSKGYSDHTILMDNGRVVNSGPPNEVLREGILKTIYQIDFIHLQSGDGEKSFIFPV